MKSLNIIILLISTNIFGAAFEPMPLVKKNNKSEWISADNPGIILGKYNPSFKSFPKAKNLSTEKVDVWADSYWPQYRGGIAYRWQLYERPKRSKLYSLKKLKKLTRKQIAKLSPAEKYDIAIGDYDYNFTKRILRQNPSSAATWRGICHGWAEASITQKAPTPKVIKNPDRLDVEFGYSDLASILSYIHAKKSGGLRYLGKRCNTRSDSSVACSGINPGALHILLTNAMHRQRSFIVDVARGPEVWNHPIVGYYFRSLEERAPSKGASKNAVKEIKINTEMYYIIENIESNTRKDSVTVSKNYLYWLELDQEDRIVGGSWISHDRPDFAWYRNRPRISSKFKFLFR